MNAPTYSEKLKDFRWQVLRQDFMESRRIDRGDENLCCDDCGAEERGEFHVHHKLYVRGREPWEYPFEDLRLLCEQCHDSIHKVEQFARAFLIGLPPSVMPEMLQVFQELAECATDHMVKVALARAKNAIREVNDRVAAAGRGMEAE